MRIRRGFLSIDAVAALIVLTALGIALAGAMGQRARTAHRLGDTRSASRLAEAALLDLQQGRRPPADVVVEELQAPEASLRWVRVSATVNGRTVSLIGAARRQP